MKRILLAILATALLGGCADSYYPAPTYVSTYNEDDGPSLSDVEQEQERVAAYQERIRQSNEAVNQSLSDSRNSFNQNLLQLRREAPNW